MQRERLEYKSFILYSCNCYVILARPLYFLHCTALYLLHYTPKTPGASQVHLGDDIEVEDDKWYDDNQHRVPQEQRHHVMRVKELFEDEMVSWLQQQQRNSSSCGAGTTVVPVSVQWGPSVAQEPAEQANTPLLLVC